MFNLIIDFDQLDLIQKKAKKLKRSFLKTELKDWNLSCYAAELLFQTTHLINNVNLWQLANYSVLAHERVNDEVADVLFNILNIFNVLKLSVDDVFPYKNDDYISISKQNILNQAVNLCINSGILWDAAFRREDYKHKIMTTPKEKIFIQNQIIKILILLLLLAQKLKIDVIKEFLIMEKNATSFLDNYERKYKIY